MTQNFNKDLLRETKVNVSSGHVGAQILNLPIIIVSCKAESLQHYLQISERMIILKVTIFFHYSELSSQK